MTARLAKRNFAMSEYRSFINNFDPRGRTESDSSGCGSIDGEYTPRAHRRSASESGESSFRRPLENELIESSPSPAQEGGDDDFDVFNFEMARRRKQEREDRLNAAIERQEAPRRVVDRIASEEHPRSRPVRQQPPHDDGASRRAAGFAGRLASYAQPLFSTPSESRAQVNTGRRRPTATPSSRSGSSAARGASGSSGSKNSGRKVRKDSGGFGKLPTAAKAAIIVGCVILVFVIIYHVALGILLADVKSLDLSSRGDDPVSEVATVELMSGSGVTNILLLGIDDDGSSGSRSDTIMIASVDSRGGNIRLCSILRDCYVEIPGRRANRINSAYAHGGVQLAVETVENNFRVKIDHCVTIDMAALVDVVDAIGGVEIELTSAEANQVNLHSHCGLTTSAGKQLLNGKQAVTYAQIRKIDSDFKRTQRQRILIGAIIEKVRGLGLGELLNLVKAVAPNIATDMSNAEIGSLALKALPALSGEMEQMTIPAEGKYSSVTINGMAVLDLDLKANATLLQEFLYGE
ncbi:MAG: LytR family transcriptional regulator [Ruminococcaceae bacterium]|nr:LytR family transcriptional regulator [Oscillospiraceae bacterium]